MAENQRTIAPGSPTTEENGSGQYVPAPAPGTPDTTALTTFVYKTPRLHLGDRVRFAAVYRRRYHGDGDIREWVVEPLSVMGFGVLFGYRLLQNGYTMGQFREWVRTGTVPCALVVTSLYKKAVRVPLDALALER
jgi:hypothetical protein